MKRKDMQNVLKKERIIKREKHRTLMSKDKLDMLKKQKIIEKEKHRSLMKKETLNLPKEEKTIKREKHFGRQFLFMNKLHVTQTNVT